MQQNIGGTATITAVAAVTPSSPPPTATLLSKNIQKLVTTDKHLQNQSQ